MSGDAKSVLLVEDEGIIALNEMKSLERLGYDVVVADSGEKAIGLVKSSTDFDLILMDINLGDGIDGTEAAKIILQQHDLPVVFLSSHTDPEIVARTEKITSYGYVVKNSGSVVLDASIKMAIRLFEANKALKQEEEALAASQDLYSSVLMACPDGISVTDLEGRISMISPSVNAMFGYDERDLLQHAITDFVIPEDRERALTNIGLMFQGIMTGPAEYRGIRKDGTAINIEVNAEIVRSSSGTGKMVFVIRDVTESRNTAGALARERNFLRVLLDNSPDFIYFKDLDSRFVRSSQSHAKLFGLSDASELIGKSDSDFYDRKMAREAREDELSIIDSGQTITKIERQIWPNHPDAWVSTMKMPLTEIDGTIIGTFGISRDVTESRRVDETIQTILTEQEIMLRELHHRMKNNMGTISSLLSLQASTVSDPQAVKALEDAVGRVQSMMILYDKLYQSPSFASISAREYLPDLVDQIIRNFPNCDNVKVQTHIGDFELDSKKLQPLGIIVNELLTNIMKYAFEGRKGGSIELSAFLEDEGANLVIHDDGVGMPESIEFAKSPGFGLMLVENLTMQLKGSIRIVRGNGTTIILRFAI